MNIADLLDGLELVSDFRYQELEMIAKYLSHEEVEQGRVLFAEGDPGDFMLIVIAGKVGIYKGGANGQHLLSTELGGRIIGEMAMIDRERRSATCIAASNCELLTLTAANLKKLAHDHPGLAYHFMSALARMLSRRLRRVSGMMADYLDH
jgi:CRP/FNR family cyclic AMP-dependent transcriptional regulator